MQGRPEWDRNREALDRAISDHLAAVNGTGKQRGIPKRPSNMARVEQPPPTPRIARPRRETPPPTNWRKRLFFWGILFVGCSILACVIGYAAVSFYEATNATAGSAATVTDFLSSLSTQNYEQAYNDLDATITVETTQNDFTQQAQAYDKCYGAVTNYSEVANSATVQGTTQSYSYIITRSKLTTPYTLRLTLQQDKYGSWKVISYTNNNKATLNTNDLGPGQPPCNL